MHLRATSSHWISLLLVLLLVAALFAIVFTAQAATITVGGGCTLADAITAANTDAAAGGCTAGAGADIIALTANVTLDGTTLFTANGPNGLPSITSDITIEGGSFTIQRVSAAPFRLLHVDAAGILTLNNVTLTGGLMSAGFDNGGGIFNAGTLTMNGSTVTGNRVDSIFPTGGGIYSADTGVVTLVNSAVTNNVALNPAQVFDYGGGIWASGNTTITNSVITGNSALMGGGMLSFDGLAPGAFRIYNSTFSSNTAVENGGAILNGSDDIQIFGTTFSGNIVQGNPNGVGGAIFNQGGTMLITASRFVGNQAQNNAIGGAIGNVTLGEITIRGSVFDSNSSLTNGGGLVTGLAETFIFDSLIRNNTAGSGGGGLYQSPSNVPGFTVVRTTVMGNSAGFIGGGFLGESTLSSSTFINSTFSGNTAVTFGGGIGLNGGGQVDVLHSTFINNSSTQFVNSVGGINAFAGTMTIGSSIIANNANEDCSATGASTSLDFNITTGPGGGFPIDRWCAFIPLQPNDQLSTDPLVNALAANGNLGPTHALQAGSPAIDAIPAACPAALAGIDQRGVPRTGVTCDVGAVSDDPVALPVVYFQTPATVLDNEGTVAGTQFVDLIIDNTAGTLAAPGSLPLMVYVVMTGSAAQTADFTGGVAAPTTYTFDAGTWVAPGTSQTIQIPIDVVDDLLPESDETIQFSIVVIGPGSATGNVAHTVTIIDDDAPPPVPAAAPGGQIGVFDPAISKIGFLRPGQTGVTGEQLEWVVTVTNPGATTGTNVVVTDTLRDDLRIDRVESSAGTATTSGQTVTVTIPALAPGESVTISIFTTVLAGAAVDNTACVTASNQTGERCATALPVSALPSTGERPGWAAALRAILNR